MPGGPASTKPATWQACTPNGTSDATRSIPRLGIDLGGTKIEIIALDGEGRELLRRRVATPRGDYAATLDAIVPARARASESALGIPERASTGIGTPGTHLTRERPDAQRQLGVAQWSAAARPIWSRGSSAR